MGVFTASTLIGVLFGIIVALMLKHSELYRYPSIETCVIALMAYSSYLFSNGAQMSGKYVVGGISQVKLSYSYRPW